MMDKIKELIEDYKFRQVVKFIIIVIIAIVLYRCTASLSTEYAKEYLPEEVVENEIENEVEEINENVTSSVVAAITTENETGVFSTSPDNTAIEELFNDTVTEETDNLKVISENDFENEVLKSDKIVIVEFYADWCNPCKIYAPTLESIAHKNPDLKVVKVDVDEAANLSLKYGAHSIPRTVIFKDGESQTAVTGLVAEEQLMDLVESIK